MVAEVAEQRDAIVVGDGGHLGPTDLLDVWSLEIAFGDGADAFSDEELAAYVGRGK